MDLAERVFINQGCTFLDYAGIRLGEGVMIGPKVTFITMGHPVDPDERRQSLTGAPIDVAENVWIGAGATILPGVSIGRDADILRPERSWPTMCRRRAWWQGRRALCAGSGSGSLRD